MISNQLDSDVSAAQNTAGTIMTTILLPIDYIALGLFIVLWMSYTYITTHSNPFFSRTSLNRAMAERRRQWIYNSLSRDLKMIDTQILAGLQNGTWSNRSGRVSFQRFAAGSLCRPHRV
jgi:hypothetical protein